MTEVLFEAFDFHADRTFRPARYRYRGDQHRGWSVERDGVPVLALGPGFRLLRVRSCGVCSTDLARDHLPFPLPQVIGHETLCTDEHGTRFVVEINASHRARGVPHDCAFCRAGLPTHCPERVTLGIHDLPGGFGPWILAPIDACLRVPDEVPDGAAVLVEPLAAALHAVDVVAPRAGERVAVLGPRRLGMLVLAALAARRLERPREHRFPIAAVLRDDSRRRLAEEFGADEVCRLGDDAEDGLELGFDVVIDTTGNPAGLAHAVRLARREVHLKSTHGQPSNGLAHLTELVVDELGIAPLDSLGRIAGGRRLGVAWTCATAPPPDLLAQHDVFVGSASEAARHFEQRTDRLPRADVAVVGDRAAVDTAIRPRPGDERSLLAPGGSVLLAAGADVSGSSLLEAVARRGLGLTSSRCGDFGAALALLAADAALRTIGDRLVTHRFTAAALPAAFLAAGRRDCIKAVIDHP